MGSEETSRWWTANELEAYELERPELFEDDLGDDFIPDMAMADGPALDEIKIEISEGEL